MKVSPGDTILYRDGDRYMIARVDLVRDGYYTSFPFDPLHRRWSRLNRRVARDFVIARLPATANVPALVAAIEALRNQREAKRQEANRWLADQVRELAQQRELA